MFILLAMALTLSSSIVGPGTSRQGTADGSSGTPGEVASRLQDAPLQTRTMTLPGGDGTYVGAAGGDDSAACRGRERFDGDGCRGAGLQNGEGGVSGVDNTRQRTTRTLDVVERDPVSDLRTTPPRPAAESVAPPPPEEEGFFDTVLGLASRLKDMITPSHNLSEAMTITASLLPGSFSQRLADFAADLAGRDPAQARGRTSRGTLVNGLNIKSAPSDCDLQRAATTGTATLVAAVGYMCSAFSSVHDGRRVSVGDLSGRYGGRLHYHGSHQNGQDVDIGLFAMNTRGEPVNNPYRWQDFSLRGERLVSDANRAVLFDSAANWDLVTLMVVNPAVESGATVKFIFTSDAIKRHLITWAERRAVDTRDAQAKAALRDVIRKASLVLNVESNHRNHFHFRLAVPGGRDEL